MATDVDYAYSTGPSSYSNDDVIGFLLRMVNQATSASSLVDNHQQQYQRGALSSSWSGATGSQGEKAMYTASNESDVWSDYQMYSDIDPYGNGSFYQRSNNSSSSSDHVMTWPQRTAWITIFSLMLFVATVGNALVAWIVLAHRRMKTVTNYFLVNLSLADLTMSLFNCIFNFTFMLNNHWPFGGFYCTVSNFIANVTVAASVFTLVAISFDRYIAIVHPLRPRMSKCIARVAISIIWLASCILAIPCLLYSQTYSQTFDGEVRIACLVVFPDGLPGTSQLDFIYNIIFMVVTYVIPVAAMGVSYSLMSHVLWRAKGIGELNQRQEESIQSKRKVVKMFIVVVLLFAVCWLPYHSYFVYQFIDRNVASYKYVQHIFLGFYWLAMSNAMINPLVYYYMNARFRQYFKTVICGCWYFRRGSLSEHAAAPHQIPNHANARLLQQQQPQQQRSNRDQNDRFVGQGAHLGGSLMLMQRGRQQQLYCPNGIVNAPVNPRMENSSVSPHQRHNGHHHCSVFQKASAVSDPRSSNENGNGSMIHSGQHQTVSNDNRCITHQPTQLITSWLPRLNGDCFSDNPSYYRSYYHLQYHQHNRRHSSYKLAIETNEMETSKV